MPAALGSDVELLEVGIERSRVERGTEAKLGEPIRLIPGEDEEGNRYPLLYEIDEFRCIFCGYCQEVCPEEAIHVGRHYENSEYSREGFVYDLQRLMDQTHPVCEMWDPADPKGE